MMAISDTKWHTLIFSTLELVFVLKASKMGNLDV